MENKLSITEGNALIAEFMGFKVHRWNYRDKSMGQTKLKDGYDHSSITYDRDWNELMDVLERISKHKYGWDSCEHPYEDYAYTRTFGMLNQEGKPMVRINANTLFTADTLIEAAWLAVVDFIEWYNNEKLDYENRKK